jgi:hypothetical protein
MRIKGYNAIFGLMIQLCVGNGVITAVASGTGVFLSALPLPPKLKLFRNLEVIDREDAHLVELQRRIGVESEVNRHQIELELETQLKEKSASRRQARRRPSENHRMSVVSESVVGSQVISQSPMSTSPVKMKPEESFVLTEDSSDSSSDGSSSGGEGEELDEDEELKSDLEFDDATPIDAIVPIETKKRSVIIQIDDERDEDLVLLIDPSFAPGKSRC